MPGGEGTAEGAVEVSSIAMGAREGEVGEDAEGFEGFADALDSEGVAAVVVGTACVDVEEDVGSLGARTDAVEVSALNDDAVGEGVAGLGLPVGFLAGVGVGGVDVVVAVIPDSQVVVMGLWDVA